MPSVAIGVPYYGTQTAEWWMSLVNQVAAMPAQGIDYGGLFTSGVSTTDINRNRIVDDFLKSDTEYLFWIDADNTPPIGALPRLLATGLPIVSGLYYSHGMDGIIPIAYIRDKEGSYRTLDAVYEWERGEIVPVDAFGMGCCLTHRSVYEKILKEYTVFQKYSGGLIPIKNSLIFGKADKEKKNSNDGKVHGGQLYTRVFPPTVAIQRFPFFVCEYGRTEDFPFCEMAQEAGFKLHIDTSVEVGHVKSVNLLGKDYRKEHHMTPNPEALEVTYVWDGEEAKA